MASSTTLILQSFDPLISKTRATIKSSSNVTRRTGLRIRAMRREAHNPSGRLVDESMIVLHKRIHEIKMIESEPELPSEWMDWEKRVYSRYDSIIYDAMGHLQSYLIETRPGVALGMLVILALSVPTSTAVVMHNLLGFSNVILSGIHLG